MVVGGRTKKMMEAEDGDEDEDGMKACPRHDGERNDVFGRMMLAAIRVTVHGGQRKVNTVVGHDRGRSRWRVDGEVVDEPL